MKGIVSSGHVRVSDAAAEILRAGGNAFDAAVGAGFASTVAETFLTSLGGGGFMLAHTAEGEDILFDFFTDTPGLSNGKRRPADPDSYHFYPAVVTFIKEPQTFIIGRGSVAVPGILKGLLHVHEKLGRLPLAEVVQPAVTLARDGVVLTEFQAGVNELLSPILSESPTAIEHFGKEGGGWLGAGEVHENPEMAAFLEDLPRHSEGFYEGDWADVIARDMEQGGGILTREDLKSYRVIERKPLSLEYRGLKVVSNPPPSLGGPLVALALSLQREIELSDGGWGSPRHLRTLAAVLSQVDRIRARGGPLPLVGTGGDDEARQTVRKAIGGTTHLNVSDSEGNVVAFSASNGQGSAYYVPGTGIQLNNMMGEEDLHPGGFHRGEAGHRIASMMSPSLILDDEGVIAALGTGGSKRIRTAVQQVIMNLVDFGLHADEAVNCSRVHFDEGVFHIEPGYPDESVASVSADWKTKIWSAKNLYFGGVHVVLPRAGEGAGDRRRDGHHLVVE